MNEQAQSLAVKRAQVEFHNFASLGEPERAQRVYREENIRRGGLLRKHLAMMGQLTPFAEIGANAGHSSYMLCNEFGADGFATDLSAHSLLHGIALMDAWGLTKAPVRIAADALNLPFADNSLRCVTAFQMLSQFMDIERVFVEVKRVLAPGGTFFFSEEPLRRKLSLRLYRCPYWEQMKPWERKLYDWGLLGFLVQDVIGAAQEESFGIRQNHTMELRDWDSLIRRHFSQRELDLSIPQRGWAETLVYRLARGIDKHHSSWVPARLLGGTLAAACRKAGDAFVDPSLPFESRLRCPDCHSPVELDAAQSIRCTHCPYTAMNEGGVYNLLRSEDKKELYPGEREDVADFSLPGHETKLGAGWYQLEGVYGNRYRWIGRSAKLTLRNVRGGPQRLRLRGFATENMFTGGVPPSLTLTINGEQLPPRRLERVGMFIHEVDVHEGVEYQIEIAAEPVWQSPPDIRSFTINLSMIQLVPRE